MPSSCPSIDSKVFQRASTACPFNMDSNLSASLEIQYAYDFLLWLTSAVALAIQIILTCTLNHLTLLSRRLRRFSSSSHCFKEPRLRNQDLFVGVNLFLPDLKFTVISGKKDATHLAGSISSFTSSSQWATVSLPADFKA